MVLAVAHPWKHKKERKKTDNPREGWAKTLEFFMFIFMLLVSSMSPK